jgi:serine O-acetyltransferase
VVLRDVPSDCTVVGIPGRIVYRSGVRVSPLEHGQLPDSEANVIRALVNRIEALEENVQQLQQKRNPQEADASDVDADTNQEKAPSCQLQDKEIQQFFNGAGI